MISAQNRPFHGFFQLLPWTRSGQSVDTTEKSASKFSKIAKFESDLLKAKIHLKSGEMLQTSVDFRNFTGLIFAR